MITATVVGLIVVLEFHTRPSAIAVTTIPAAGAAAASPAGSAPSTGQFRDWGRVEERVKGQGQGRTDLRAQGEFARQAEQFQDGRRAPGELQLGRAVGFRHGVRDQITKVGIASLDDGGNPHSQSIDQNSIPVLEQQAVAAQSANIQGVSGASYTSAGFKQSLQAALQQLGVG